MGDTRSDLILTGLCGSLRRASLNRKLMLAAVESFGPADFRDGDLRLPLYDGDLEAAEGIPAPVARLAAQIDEADAVIFASPEYNKALTGVMKNALDWVSRTKGAPLRDKPVAILSASPGRAGGDRSQFSLRLALVAFRPVIVPGPEVLVAQAGEAFDAAGRLQNDRYRKALDETTALLRRHALATREARAASAAE